MAGTGKTFELDKIGHKHQLCEFDPAELGARLDGVTWIVNRAVGQPVLEPCDRLAIATVAGTGSEEIAAFLRVTDGQGKDKDLVFLQPDLFQGRIRWLAGTSAGTGLTWYLIARTDGMQPDGATPCRRLVVRVYTEGDKRIRPPQMALQYVSGEPSRVPEPACDSPDGREARFGDDEEGDGYKQD